MIYKLKIDQDRILKDIDIFIGKFRNSTNLIFLRETKQFLASINDSSLNYLDDRIKTKIDLLKIKYISIKNDLSNGLNKQCGAALENLEKGDYSEALRAYGEIIENLEKKTHREQVIER